MIYQTQTFFTPFQFVSNKVYTFNFTINKFHVFSFFHAERSTLLNNINKIDNTVLNKSESIVTRILPYGNESFVNEVNLILLNATIDFTLSTNRFDKPIYHLTGAFPFIHD